MNGLFFFAGWLLTISTLFFLNNFFRGFFGFDLFWVWPMLALRYKPGPVALLVVLFYGLTADAFVLSYPGILSFTFLLVGFVYYRFYSKLLLDGMVGFLVTLLVSLLLLKLLQFTILLILGKVVLFGWFFIPSFWVSILLSLALGAALFGVFPWFKQRFGVLK